MINTGSEVLCRPTGREATMKIARVLVLLACAALSGCARLQVLGGAMGGGGVEQAEGNFHIVHGHNQQYDRFRQLRRASPDVARIFLPVNLTGRDLFDIFDCIPLIR